MFCINCGKEIPDGIKFCNYCGVAVRQSKSAPSQPEFEGIMDDADLTLPNDMQKSIVQQATFQQPSGSQQAEPPIDSQKEDLNEGGKKKALHILAIICLLLIIIALIGGIAILVKLIWDMGILGVSNAAVA